MQWTKEQAAELYAMCVNGKSDEEIANCFSVSPDEIREKRNSMKRKEEMSWQEKRLCIKREIYVRVKRTIESDLADSRVSIDDLWLLNEVMKTVEDDFNDAYIMFEENKA